MILNNYLKKNCKCIKLVYRNIIQKFISRCKGYAICLARNVNICKNLKR